MNVVTTVMHMRNTATNLLTVVFSVCGDWILQEGEKIYMVNFFLL
jgi:hypothetical protein